MKKNFAIIVLLLCIAGLITFLCYRGPKNLEDIQKSETTQESDDSKYESKRVRKPERKEKAEDKASDTEDKDQDNDEDKESEVDPNAEERKLAESLYGHLLVEYDDNGTYYYEAGFDRQNTVYKWGADATSIYAYLENGESNIIAGHEADDYYEETLEFLDKAWGITDRESAKEVIDRMLVYGHEVKFKVALEDEDIAKAIDAIYEEYGDSFSYEDALSINEKFFKDHSISTRHFYEVKGAACAYARFGEDAMKGYDYLRLIRVVALSYECGYLTEEETYSLLYNMETELQNKFSSFKDIHECYYYGEMFRLATKKDSTTVTINDIVDTIDEMEADRFYNKIEKRFDKDIIRENNVEE